LFKKGIKKPPLTYAAALKILWLFSANIRGINEYSAQKTTVVSNFFYKDELLPLAEQEQFVVMGQLGGLGVFRAEQLAGSF